jgi:hypothetical protein
MEGRFSIERRPVAMSKILFGAALIAAVALTTGSANAMGGGWTPYWASPWYSPDGRSTAIEGRSSYIGEPVQAPENPVRERRSHQSHRRASGTAQ